MTTLERLQMQSNNRLNPYFYSSQNSGIIDAFEYTAPKIRDTVLGTKAQYDAIIDYSKALYSSEDNDPNSYETRMMLGQIISNLLPGVSSRDASKYAEDYMYRATGYKTDINSYREHIENTFRSSGSSMLASFELFGLYAMGALRGYDELWQEQKKEKMAHIRSHAMNYRVDNEYNDNIFENAVTAAASILPSMLPSIGISGIAAFLSSASGAALAASFPAIVSGWSNMSTLSKAINLARIGASFGTSAMMEGGGTMLELAQAGADDDLIFRVGTAIGVINGMLETVADTDIDLASKPIKEIFSALGEKASGKYLREAMHDTIETIGKKVLSSVVSETPTEIMQEMSSMLGFNFALEVQKDRGRPLSDYTEYTDKDFADAFFETLKQTVLGTGLISLGGGALSLITQFPNSALSRIANQNRLTSPVNADADINTSEIRIPNKTIDINDFSGKTEPINVIRIGNKYVPVNPTDEQIYAMRNSGKVYIKNIDLSSEKAVGHSVSADNSASFSPMTADTVLATIEKGIYHNEIAGFTFYDDSMSPTTDMSSAAYASIVSNADTTTPVLIRLTTDNDSASVDSLETTLFGRILAKPEWSTQSVKDIRNREKQRKKEAKKTKNKRNETRTENTQQSTEQNTETLSVAQDPDVSTEIEADDSIQDAAYQDVSPEDMEMIEDIVSEIERRADEEISSFADEETSSTENTEETSDISPNTAETASSPTENTEIDTDDDNVITEADIPNPEQIQRNTEREQRVAEFRQAQEEWENTKKNLTGKDINNDIDVLADRFEKVLAKTKVGEKPELLKASARSSAMIMTGFMRASGMTGKEYFDTIKGILTGTLPEDSAFNIEKNTGWYDAAERYIGIMENANPTTISHELGHHFLSVLAPDNPYYQRIAATYREQFEADGGVFGTNLQEAFCADLENYIRGRQSSNKEMNNIFDKIYQIAKSMWASFKNYLNLTPEKKELFDSIFGEKIDDNVSENIQKADIKADKTENPSVTLADEIVPESAETITEEKINKSVDNLYEEINEETESVISESHTAYVQEEPVNEGQKLAEFVSPENIISDETGTDAEYWTYEDYVPEGLDYMFDIREKGYPENEDADAESKRNSYFDIKDKNNAKNLDLTVNGKKATEANILEDRANEIADTDMYIFGWSAKKREGQDFISVSRKPNLTSIVKKNAVYKYISKIVGIDGIDGSFAEIYLDDNQSVFVKMKNEIRYNDDTEEYYLVPMNEPRWLYIPFNEEFTEETRAGISMEDNMAELGLLDDFDKIENEGKNYSSFMIAAAYLSDYAKWTERRTDKANFEDLRKRSRSLPKQRLFYSTTENPETNSENIIDSVARITLEGLKDSKVRTIYSKFYERVLKATENASKEFEADYQKDIKEHSDNQEYIAEMEKNKQDSLLSAQNYAIAQEFGVESFNDINSLFEQYLMQDEDIKNAISAYGENSSDVLKRIADYLKFTGNSYTTTSQILSTALRNPSKYRKNGIRLINRMLLGWRAASKLTKEGKPTYMSEAFQFSKSFFGADSKVHKIFMKIRELGTYDDVDKSMENMKESITDEEWDVFFKALVNPEYKIPNGLTNDKKTGRLTSPLMILSNYLEGYREGNPRTSDSFEYAGEDFTSYSHDMLVSRIEEINQERREKGLEPLKIEDYFEKNRNIIRDLTMTLAAAGGTMKDLFNDKTTKGTVDAIKNAIDRKIESLNEEISKLRKSANTGDAKALNEEIAKLNREKARRENRIKTLEKSRDNSKQALKDYKDSTRNELNDAKKKARNLEKQIEQKQKELDSINIKLNTKIDKLNAKIDALRNSNEYYQTKELERKYVAAFEHIDNLASSGNQRLAISLKRIVDFMKNYRETVVSDDLFTSKYEEYNQILTYVRDSLINAGILVERDNETVINKPLHQESPDNNKRKKKGVITGVYGMTIKELARFTSIIRNARKIGLDISKEEKQERGEFYSDLENGSIRSIPMFEEMSDAEVDSEIQNLRDSTVVGSATDEYNRNSRISGVINNFRLVEPFMKRKFPVLHAFIFGGDLANGKYNENNLNAANNRRARESLDRKEKLTSQFKKLFGEKLNFEIDSRRIFVKNKVVLGNMSAADFAKKRGFSWGQVLEDGTVDVSDYIKRNIKYKPIAEEILRTYDNYKKARDNAYIMLTGLELEETLASLKADFDKKMNGVKADEFTMDQLMGIYIYARQKGGLRRLINNKIIDGKRTGNSIPLGKVLWVVDQFENNPEYAEYREFADYLQKEISSKYEDVAQVYYNITGNILSQEDYYFGLVSEDSEVLNALELIKDESDASNAKRINYNVADWFTKDRNHGTSALNLHVVDIASRAIDAQEKYIHLAEPLNMLRKLFEKEGRFEAALISAYGAKKGVQINKLFYDWVERQMSNPVISDNAFTNVISMLRRNKTISLLTLNATTILNNFPTVLLAGNEYGIKNTIVGITRYLADKKEKDAFVYEKSPQMRERARLELAEFKADLRRLTERGSIAEQIEFLKEHGIDDKILASEDFIRRVNAKLLDWQNGFDRGVANAMWMIAYETEMNKGIPEGVDANTFSTMCAEKATQFVLSTNPSQNVKDNALIYSSKEQLVKNLLLFTAQLNKQFNMFWNSAADLTENRNLESLGRFFKTFMYLGIVSGLAAMIAGTHLKDDDDDDKWYSMLGRLLSATGTEMIGMVPFAGTAIRDVLTGALYYDSGIPGDFINLVKVIGKEPEDRREGQLRRAIINAVGDIAEITGMPFNGPVRKTFNVFAPDDDVAVNFLEVINSKWGDAYNRWVS